MRAKKCLVRLATECEVLVVKRLVVGAQLTVTDCSCAQLHTELVFSTFLLAVRSSFEVEIRIANAESRSVKRNVTRSRISRAALE